MPLNPDIQAFLAKAQLPPPVVEKLGVIFARLEAARVGAGAPGVGAQAPDASFTDVSGARVSLRDLLARGPVVLIFYRGRWCPFCDLTLRAFDAAAGEVRAAGARVVGVSPQTQQETALTGSERNLGFELLSDPHSQASEAFGLAWSLNADEKALYAQFGSMLDRANGDDRWELPAPAAFIIDRANVVRWSWVDSNWTRRPEPADVVDVLRSLKLR